MYSTALITRQSNTRYFPHRRNRLHRGVRGENCSIVLRSCHSQSSLDSASFRSAIHGSRHGTKASTQRGRTSSFIITWSPRLVQVPALLLVTPPGMEAFLL
jgi:hypothetical protein